MFKLIEMVIATLICGLSTYGTLIYIHFPRVETFIDLIYALIIQFSIGAFAQTMWLIGITREDKKRVHNESRSSRLSARRSRV